MNRLPVRTLVACLVLLAASGAAAVAQVYFPAAGEWERRRPEAVGMNAGLLREAVDFAIASESGAPRDLRLQHFLSFGREPMDEPIGPHKTRGDMTGIIIRNGYVVAEWGDPDRVDMTFSVTKTFLSTAVGLAFDQGLIPDVHDRVRSYAPASLFASEHNGKITWDHLLRQTSDWEGTLFDKPDWVDRPAPNVTEYMNRERDEPGSVYKYNDVRVNVLALSVLYVWRQPLPLVLRERIMDPIGASRTWQWHGYRNSWVNVDGVRMQSVSGGGHWGGGMFINAWDMGRFGYLFLNRGAWDGRQLISTEWIALARTPGSANEGYGFMNWFLNTDQRMSPSTPATSVQFRGAGTNVIYVDWENDLVVVARWIQGGAVDAFLGKVRASIRDTDRN